MKIIATIEARMSSSRLPGKVLMEAAGTPMLYHLLKRLSKAQFIDDFIIATTDNPKDDQIINFANSHNFKFFRGSEDDVMSRVIGAAEFMNAELVVEITGDCPLIDPSIVDQVISTFLNNDVEYVSNVDVRSFPDGMDVQVFSLKTLKKSASLTKDEKDREHVTLHIRKNPEIFSRINFVSPPELFWPELGLTLDEYPSMAPHTMGRPARFRAPPERLTTSSFVEKRPKRPKTDSSRCDADPSTSMCPRASSSLPGTCLVDMRKPLHTRTDPVHSGMRHAALHRAV